MNMGPLRTNLSYQNACACSSSLSRLSWSDLRTCTSRISRYSEMIAVQFCWTILEPVSQFENRSAQLRTIAFLWTVLERLTSQSIPFENHSYFAGGQFHITLMLYFTTLLACCLLHYGLCCLQQINSCHYGRAQYIPGQPSYMYMHTSCCHIDGNCSFTALHWAHLRETAAQMLSEV